MSALANWGKTNFAVELRKLRPVLSLGTEPHLHRSRIRITFSPITTGSNLTQSENAAAAVQICRQRTLRNRSKSHGCQNTQNELLPMLRKKHPQQKLKLRALTNQYRIGEWMAPLLQAYADSCSFISATNDADIHRAGPLLRGDETHLPFH